jgi:hypothetical protein
MVIYIPSPYNKGEPVNYDVGSTHHRDRNPTHNTINRAEHPGSLIVTTPIIN